MGGVFNSNEFIMGRKGFIRIQKSCLNLLGKFGSEYGHYVTRRYYVIPHSIVRFVESKIYMRILTNTIFHLALVSWRYVILEDVSSKNIFLESELLLDLFWNIFEPRNDVFTFSLSWILDIAKSYVRFEPDLMAWNR